MTLLLLQKVNLLGRPGLDLRMYSHLGLTGMKLAGLDLAEFVSTSENSVSFALACGQPSGGVVAADI